MTNRKELLREFLLMNLGTLLVSVGVYFFKFPNHFSMGGVSGLAVLLGKLLPQLSPSTFNTIINVLFLVLGFVMLNRGFGARTVYCSILSAGLIQLFEWAFPMDRPLTDQLMLELFFAVILPALGSAILFNIDASSGGTDVIALILKKYTHMQNTGEALFLTDLAMVLAACFVFDLYTALYSFVGLTVKSLVVDAVLEQMKMCKAILIICDDKDPICDFVMRKLVRGATYTPCYGAYTDRPHYMIYTTLTHREALQLQAFIHKENLNAFISMLSTTEVFGKGFNHA